MFIAAFKIRLGAIVFLAMSILSATGHGQVADPTTLKDEIPKLARRIKSYLDKDARVSEVDVRKFECDPGITASAGQAIQVLLINSLRDLGIKQRPGARHTCTGVYTFIEEDNKVLIETSIYESGDRRAKYNDIETNVKNVEDVVVLAAGSGAIDVSSPEKIEQTTGNAVVGPPPPPPAAQGVNAKLVTAVVNPTGPLKIGALHVNKNVASASASGTYGIEVCRLNKDTGEYVSVPLEDSEGLAFAALDAEDVYAIRIYNRSPYHAAVNITIDGLNLFTISDVPAYKEHGKIVIPPSPNGYLLRGWHKNNLKSHQFEVGFLPDALVAKVVGLAKVDLPAVATITATFAAALGPNEPLPPDEPQFQSLATKVGAEFGEVFNEVHMRFGAVREVISIRYDRPSSPPAGNQAPVNLPAGNQPAGNQPAGGQPAGK